MLHWKATFIILAIVFGVIGFIGIGNGALEPAKIVCGIFVLLLITFWVADYIYRERR